MQPDSNQVRLPCIGSVNSELAYIAEGLNARQEHDERSQHKAPTIHIFTVQLAHSIWQWQPTDDSHGIRYLVKRHTLRRCL